MKDAYSEEFKATLKKMKWPGKDVQLSESLEEEWVAGVKMLLDLQEPELEAHNNSEPLPTDEPLVLLPLEVMVKPLELRFKYHFEGDRPTNKLDKVLSYRGPLICMMLINKARILLISCC